MKILIMGCDKDPQIMRVKKMLTNMGIDHVYVDYTKDVSDISYAFPDNISPGLNFNAIYWRTPLIENSNDVLYTVQDICVQQEAWNIIFPINSVIPIKCINPMLENLKAENKIFQLSLAQNCNLKIPKTIISSNYLEIKNFTSSVPFCIQKNLGYHWDDDNRPSKTRIFDSKLLDKESKLPCIYQEQIKRKHEIRLYVIGHEYFTVKIIVDDQNSDIPDWRLCHRDYQEGNLRDSTLNRILDFHKRAKLVYAAYDLIVDKDDNEYFIECNPCGYWDFLPEVFAQKITSAICDELIMAKE